MDDTQKPNEELEATPDADKVEEGEIVAEESTNTETPSQDSSQATILESLESLIRENLVKIAKLSEEVKKFKEMIDSTLLNDEIYTKHDEAAKEAAKVKSTTRQEILKRPENATIAQKAKDVSNEIKEIKDSMNSYLQEYQRLSGSNEIEDENGNPMQIVYVARLVRR